MNRKSLFVYIAFVISFTWTLTSCSQSTSDSSTPTAAEVTVADPTQTVAIVDTAPPEPTVTPTEIPTLVPTVTAPVIPTPTEEPQPMARFMLASDPNRSILPPSERSEFSQQLNGTGAVIYHEGQFHMFFNAIQGGWPPDDIAIGYMTSPDGLNWELAAEEPVLFGSQAPFDIHTIYAGSVVVDLDGTWQLYFHTISDQSAEGEENLRVKKGPDEQLDDDNKEVPFPGQMVTDELDEDGPSDLLEEVMEDLEVEDTFENRIAKGSDR